VNSDHIPAGTRTGWILVACLVGLIATFASWVAYAGRQKQEKDRNISDHLISEFHNRFNNLSEDSVYGPSSPYYESIEGIRSRTGQFKSLGKCEIKGYVEPPRLTAKCISSFEKGDAEEWFSFRDDGRDHRLLAYSAKLIERNLSPGNK
jgi:hypothetical protein